MITKTLALFSATALVIAATTSGLRNRAADAVILSDVPAPVAEVLTAYNTLVSDLASERHALNSERKETWILTIHDGSIVREYTDSKYTLLSLPVGTRWGRSATCDYVNAYNCLNLRAADLLVRQGQYKEAKEVCQLLARFGCQGSLVAEEAKRRLPYLEELEKGGDVAATLKQLEQLYVDYGSTHDFAQIERMTPKAVTNLLEVNNR